MIEKLASTKNPAEPVDSALGIPVAVSEIKSAIQCQNNEAERKGTGSSKLLPIPTKPNKLDLSSTGISKKAADIINSIRQSTSSSSISEVLCGSEKAARIDTSKEFFKCSDTSILFGTSSSSKQSKKFPTSKSISNLGKVCVEHKAILTDVHSGVGFDKDKVITCVSVGTEPDVGIGIISERSVTSIEDEVEIVSLLDEPIPKYKLRADTITQFTGEKSLLAPFIFSKL